MSSLNLIFDSIAVSENLLLKNSVKAYVKALLDDAILNICHKHNTPSFDDVMYGYSEQRMAITKVFTCQASLTCNLQIEARLEWRYDYHLEEYSEMEVEFHKIQLNHMDNSFDLYEYINEDDLEEEIVKLANRVAVEQWDIKE